MTRNQINQYLVAILTTLADIEQPAPKSPFYLLLDMDINRYQTLESIMVDGGLVRVTADTMSLTDEGRAMVVRIREKIPGV